MPNLMKYVKEHNRIVVSILIAIGFALLWCSTFCEANMGIYVLMINLGATFIVSAIALGILSHMGIELEKLADEERKKLHIELKVLKNKIIIKLDTLKNDLTNKIEILAEAKRSGIVHVFESRRKDPNFKKELLKQFRKIPERGELILMSNSCRDFFGNSADPEYIKEIFKILKKDVKFKVLLLDPTSRAAKDRALVEQKDIVKDKDKGYIYSAIFREIKNVANILQDPSEWVQKDEMTARILKQVHVRFAPYDPTTQLIITNKYTFIEQYHRGGDKKIRNALDDEGIPLVNCFGGFVPILMVENTSFFSNLMQSHFNNIWNAPDVEKRDLRRNNYYQEILKFEKKELEKLKSR